MIGLRPARTRSFLVPGRARALLAFGALAPTLAGAAVIGAMTFRGLPMGSALGDPQVLSRSVLAAVVFTSIAAPTGSLVGIWIVTAPIDATTVSTRRALIRTPIRLGLLQTTVWLLAALVMVIVNRDLPWLAATMGVCIVLGGVVTATVVYWSCARILRPYVAPILTEFPPTRPQRPGLRMRAVSAWLVGSGVPMLTLLLVAFSALVVDYPGDRLAVVVLVLVALGVASGLFATTFTAATTADPIDEVRRGMQRVRSGDYDVTVPVFDASELGLLQAGFNVMAEGLRDRERIRDLFGRHVGREVAKLAEESDRPSEGPLIGGATCEVAVLFVDLIGSSRLAANLPAQELVALLNQFFDTVVEVIDRNLGWVNKFEGDAAMAVFGAPGPSENAACHALAAARELGERLNQDETRVGIGVSAGSAVAGNIGSASRHEYTVIGDPVNEASRLSEYAKLSGGVAVSGAVLARASLAEAARWKIVESSKLRGRDTVTNIAVPR